MISAGWGLWLQHPEAVDEVAVVRRMHGDAGQHLTLPEREALVREMVHRGLTDTDIADRTGYAHQTIWRIRRRLGLESGRMGIVPRDDDRLISIYEIPDLTGYSLRTVRKWVSERSGLLRPVKALYVAPKGGPRHLYRLSDVRRAEAEWRERTRR